MSAGIVKDMQTATDVNWQKAFLQMEKTQMRYRDGFDVHQKTEPSGYGIAMNPTDTFNALRTPHPRDRGCWNCKHESGHNDHFCSMDQYGCNAYTLPVKHQVMEGKYSINHTDNYLKHWKWNCTG